VCGIVGMWERTGKRAAFRLEDLDAALARLGHRGPDHRGRWQSERDGLVLGHARLSILDLSPLAHQPMASPDGRHVITYNGEIYNFPEIRGALEAAGRRFRSTSDTEVLLAGYAQWGPAVLDRLVGMFAFAIWDARESTLFLARDRAGEKPLYYAAAGSTFAFASETSALTCLPDIDAGLDADAVALYLEQQVVPAPLSIYRGIRKLPPAHAMLVTRAQLRTWRYWDPTAIALQGPRAVDDRCALDQLDEHLRDAVRQQLVSDVPLGAFLSGGIDSTAVVAMMTETSSAPVKTFTIGFDVPGHDEAEDAGRVAAHLGTDHTVEVLTEKDAAALVPAIPAMYGEPFADSSALPTRLVASVARKQVTVSLSGDGGDELFGGYTRYRQLAILLALGRAGLRDRRLLALARHAPGRLGRFAQVSGEALAYDPYRPFLSAFSPPEVERLTGRPVPAYEAYDAAWTAAASLPVRRRAMLTDFVSYLPEDILTKVDRAAMSVSLETRAPFLDHRLIEWSLSLPLRLVRNKRLLKELAYRKVPRQLLDRPKRGFSVPLGTWFRGELRSDLEEALSPPLLEAVGVHGHDFVARLLREHLEGRRSHKSRLWALFVLSRWGAENGA